MNVAEIFERQARYAPDAKAVVMGSYTATYGQLLAMELVIAQRLQEAGVAAGDRIGLVAENPVGHIALSLAIARIGAVSAGIPPGTPAAQLDGLAAGCGLTHLVHGTSGAPALQRIPPGRLLSFAALSAPARGPVRAEPPVQAEPGAAWRISLSSGTTGVPKGVERDHVNSCLIAALHRAFFPVSAGDGVLIGMDVAMTFAVHNWLRALSVGATIVLPTGQTAEAVMRAVHEHAPVQCFTTTGMVLGMAQLSLLPGSPYASPHPRLQAICMTGAAVPPRIQAILRERVCARIQVNYGSTEVGVMAIADTELLDRDPACAGRIVPWIEVQAVDEAGRPVPEGTRGRLRFRGAGLSSGYCGGDAAGGAGERFEGGWFLSSDLGVVTPQGMLYLAGRNDDVINIGGVKIDPVRVEAVIERDPAIVESAVILGADNLGAPVLVAVVVARGEPDRDAIAGRCTAALGPNCVPGAFIAVAALPRGAMGKIDRKALQAHLRSRPPQG